MNGQQAGIAHFFWGTPRETGSKNCAISKGNLQLAVGSLAGRTAQFPEGTSSWLLGSLEAKTM